MMNVSQLRDHERAVSLFVESLDALLAPARFEIVSAGDMPATAIPVSTARSRFGWLLATGGQLSPPQTMLLQNAAQILALTLEKIQQDAYLAGERQRLEDAVTARTAELARSERRTRHIFECNAGGIIVLDSQGTIIDVNAEACRIFDLQRECWLGLNVSDQRMTAVQADGSPLLPNQLPAMMAVHTRSPVRNVVIGVPRHSSPTRWLLVSAEPVVEDATGEIREVIATFQDITAIRQAEEERRNIEARALQAQKLESLGVLAGGIAHDFNNLLTGILGNASLAREILGPDTEAGPELRLIETATKQAADLTGQLLAYAGKGRVAARALDLSKLIHETVPLLHVASGKRCPIQLECCSDAWVHADASQLRQVVMNLAINAVEAVGEAPGGVRITTRLEHFEAARLAKAHVPSNLPDGDFVVLEVSDTGCGLDRDCVERIFEPFFSTKFTGRGLGLAAVQGIVKLHQGALEIETCIGEGTTFRVVLPAQQQGLREVTNHVDAGKLSSGLLLVVDDEDLVRALASRALRQAGYEVLEAADGREALTLIDQHVDKLRLVLLDATMPHLDGRQTLVTLRDRGIQTKVILSSGYTDLGEEEVWRPMGVCAFLPKPFVPSALRALVQRVLGD
jgi:PAS domain S-box-containing protein